MSDGFKFDPANMPRIDLSTTNHLSKSNEQQDELIEIIAEVLTIAKARSQAEAKSVYTKVMGRITQTIKDAETLAKIAGYATAVWNLAQPIIEKLP
jgi:undecaprenyl pyrophosphate synthase